MRARPGRLVVAAALALASASSIGAARAEPVRTAPRVVAHEWGVWKVRAGAVAHLEELAAESPWFVHRARGAPAWAWPPPAPPPVFPPVLLRPLPGPVYVPVPAPAPPPSWDPWSRPRPARKPVIFLTTDRPVDMTVSVAFRGGGPWLYYPTATEGSRPDGSGELSWQGRLVPTSRSRAPLQPVPPGHFWSRLRDVGADLFLSDGGTAERFLFYDGPVAFERPFAVAVRGEGALVAARSTERSLWLVASGRWSEVLAGRLPARGAVVAEGPIDELPERLHASLVARGLAPAEARSLLDTWDWELFRAPGRRAIAFVPRAVYDHMLPCRIRPEPAELVRVGLVIEDLDGPAPRSWPEP